MEIWRYIIETRVIDQLKCFCKNIFGVLEIVFYTILPTITLGLFYILMDVDSSFWEKFNEKGEFILYSLALFSSALITTKYYKRKNLTLIIMFIIITSIMYALIVMNECKESAIKPNVVALNVSSFILFSFSLVFTYNSVKVQKEHNLDAKRENNNSVERINEKIKF